MDKLTWRDRALSISLLLALMLAVPYTVLWEAAWAHPQIEPLADRRGGDELPAVTVNRLDEAIRRLSENEKLITLIRERQVINENRITLLEDRVSLLIWLVITIGGALISVVAKLVYDNLARPAHQDNRVRDNLARLAQEGSAMYQSDMTVRQEYIEKTLERVAKQLGQMDKWFAAQDRPINREDR